MQSTSKLHKDELERLKMEHEQSPYQGIFVPYDSGTFDFIEPTIAYRKLGQTVKKVKSHLFWQQGKQLIDPLHNPFIHLPAKASHNHIRIVSISDTHAMHAKLAPLPPGDILLHAGDFSNIGEEKDIVSLIQWLQQQPFTYKVIIAGNHDVSCDEANYESLQKRFHRRQPVDTVKIKNMLRQAGHGIIYLEDQSVELTFPLHWQDHNHDAIQLAPPKIIPDVANASSTSSAAASMLNKVTSWFSSSSSAVSSQSSSPSTSNSASSSSVEKVNTGTIKIYGTPWQPEFFDWAFNLSRGCQLREKWDMIPADGSIDILMSHGPPIGHGDLTQSGERTGCVDLLLYMQQRIKPLVSVAGHIHEGYGCTTDGRTLIVNASVNTVKYVPTNLPIVFDLPLQLAKAQAKLSHESLPSLDNSGPMDVHNMIAAALTPSEPVFESEC